MNHIVVAADVLLTQQSPQGVINKVSTIIMGYDVIFAKLKQLQNSSTVSENSVFCRILRLSHDTVLRTATLTFTHGLWPGAIETVR